MAEEIRHEKKVTLELDRPFQTNGQVFKNGDVVPADIAEDLHRRQKTYTDYEKSLIRNQGRQLDAGNIIGNQAV